MTLLFFPFKLPHYILQCCRSNSSRDQVDNISPRRVTGYTIIFVCLFRRGLYDHKDYGKISEYKGLSTDLLFACIE